LEHKERAEQVPTQIGRPKGKKMLKTLEREQAREFVRQYVTEHLEPMIEA
jgi:hypothetical protein